MTGGVVFAVKKSTGNVQVKTCTFPVMVYIVTQAAGMVLFQFPPLNIIIFGRFNPFVTMSELNVSSERDQYPGPLNPFAAAS